jgi:hypothetical protein
MPTFDDEPQPGDVEIMISHGHSNEPPYHQIHIEVTERISKQRILDVRLTPEQFGTLLGSTTVYASAELPAHPERIGRRMEIKTTHLSYEQHLRQDVDTAAENRAAGYRSNGWDSVSVSRTNTGRTVTARRWVEP